MGPFPGRLLEFLSEDECCPKLPFGLFNHPCQYLVSYFGYHLEMTRLLSSEPEGLGWVDQQSLHSRIYSWGYLLFLTFLVHYFGVTPLKVHCAVWAVRAVIWGLRIDGLEDLMTRPLHDEFAAHCAFCFDRLENFTIDNGSTR